MKGVSHRSIVLMTDFFPNCHSLPISSSYFKYMTSAYYKFEDIKFLLFFLGWLVHDCSYISIFSSTSVLYILSSTQKLKEIWLPHLPPSSSPFPPAQERPARSCFQLKSQWIESCRFRIMGSDRAKNGTGIYRHFFTQEAVNCLLQLFGLFEDRMACLFSYKPHGDYGLRNLPPPQNKMQINNLCLVGSDWSPAKFSTLCLTGGFFFSVS